ncbi:MAG: hypothetical protein Tsb0020_36890 [Haliangiales bacterium]
MRRSRTSSALALLAWLALFVNLCATGCGLLGCGLALGPGCCAAAASASADPATDDPGPAYDQAHRGPCACCGDITPACATSAPPAVQLTGSFEAPAPPAAIEQSRPTGRAELRPRAIAPPAIAAQPPRRPSPTATVVLLC